MMSEICRCIEGSCLGLEGGNPFGICRMGNGVVKPSIAPSPVEGVVLPERIVTDHDRKAAHDYNCSPVRIGETDRLKTAEECCLERQLAEAIDQRDEARLALEDLYDKVENGDPCTENGDIDGSYVGNCVHLSYEEEERILALIGPGPSTKPLHDGKPSWQERATEAEAALATARAQGREEGLREAIVALGSTFVKLEFPTKFSKGTEVGIVQGIEAIKSLIPKK